LFDPPKAVLPLARIADQNAILICLLKPAIHDRMLERG